MQQNHSLHAFDYLERAQYFQDGVPTFSSLVPSRFGFDLLQGVNNPNYQVQIARRLNAATAYYRRQTTAFSPLRASGQDSFPLQSWYTVPTMFSGLVTTFPSSWGAGDYTGVNTLLNPQRDIALKHVKNKLATKTTQVQGLIPVVEFRDLRTTYSSMVDLTTHTIDLLANGWKAVHTKKDRLRKFKKFASDTWLTYSFGIAPTMSDFDSILEGIGHRLTTSGQMVKEVGGSSTTFNVPCADQSFVLYNPTKAGWKPTGSKQGIVKCSGSYQYTAKVFINAGRFFDPKSGNNYSVNDQFGLNIGNVIPAAYELFPYSWLLDYFTTMGSFLEDTFTSPAGIAVYTTRTHVLEYNLSANAVITEGIGRVINTPKDTGYIVRREVLPGLPATSLRIKTLDEISNNATNKLLNLLSLCGGKGPGFFGTPQFKKLRS